MSETEKETISKKPHPKPWKPVEKKSISICLHPQSWEKISNQCRKKINRAFRTNQTEKERARRKRDMGWVESSLAFEF